MIKSLDLFAGCGGLSHGLSMAGIKTAVANELEAVFCQTYRLNHPETMVVEGSILDDAVFQSILDSSLGVDLVVGGPPCQGFSTVGKKNEGDPRNRLFWRFLESIEALRPRVVLFENVSGFKRLYGGRAFNALTSGFEELGYRVHWQVLNAADYGAPQFRERTIVVGVKTEVGGEFNFPLPSFGPVTGLFGQRPHRTLEDALSDLPIVGMGESSDRYASEPMNEFQRAMRKAHHEILLEHSGPNHGEKLTEVMSHVPKGGSVLDVPVHLRPRSYFLNTYARLWWDRPAPTMTRNFGTPSSSRCIHPKVNRGLTTREGARLQTFPDSYELVGTRTQKNLQIGNAVPPILGEVLGRAILECLDHPSISGLQHSPDAHLQTL